MSQYSIAVLPGDGIGPEVVTETVKTLRSIENRFPLQIELTEYSVGAGELLKSGDPLPPPTFEAIQGHDAVLLGAMGLPDVRWPNGTEMAPQLDLREKLDLYARLRPLTLVHPDATPLKGYESGGIDMMILRENCEGLFWSRKGSLQASDDEMIDGMRISRAGSERLFRAAFEQAEKRRGKVTLVDKANVLPSLAYFRRIFDEVAEQFPEIEAERLYIDASTLYLVQRPESFDVIVTENMFGDILSDLAAGLVGGMGMAPSADVGDKYAVFQPSHGSAPDIAGQGKANPTATILSAAMMLAWLGESEAADTLKAAVELTMSDPANWTPDLTGTGSTSLVGQRVRSALC